MEDIEQGHILLKNESILQANKKREFDALNPPFLLQNKFLKEIWITLCFPNPLTFFYSLKQSIKAVSAILSFIFRPLQPFPLPLPFCAIQSAPLTGKQWKCLM